jgi:hypothetical protein
LELLPLTVDEEACWRGEWGAPRRSLAHREAVLVTAQCCGEHHVALIVLAIWQCQTYAGEAVNASTGSPMKADGDTRDAGSLILRWDR